MFNKTIKVVNLERRLVSEQIPFLNSRCPGSWRALAPLWSSQLLPANSREITKAKSPLAIQQCLRSFAGLMLAPKGGIWTGPRSARVKPCSLTPYWDFYPPSCSQWSTRHLIDINCPFHAGSSMLTHPASVQIHTNTCLILFRFRWQSHRPAVLSLPCCYGNFPRIRTSTLPWNSWKRNGEKLHLWNNF